MTSTYSLPAAAIPSHHHHSSDHIHSHSRSQASLGSLHGSRSRKTSEPASNGSANMLHDHSHSCEHNHSQYRANSNHPLVTRPNLPPPLANGHWKTDSTAGGKPLITPSNASFDAAGAYQPPPASDPQRDRSLERSRFTSLLLPYTSRWPLLHAIVAEKDSRRIFYFMTLNFCFMGVQAFYGYVTDSLGLLSDSIHMFFDCVALAVGLFAAVASKWPPSERFPYGFGKIETLSGFANGLFLVLISVEIMFEAFERIIEGRETKRLMELFVVSTLGLLVNLVGMFAFGHHHHGHDHSSSCGGGHSHSHSHDEHSHGHSHDHSHDNSHSHSHSHDEKHGHSHGHSHAHSHTNENMYGIYLHVLADTLGSGAVIVSTILTRLWGWAGWDPLASFLIAVLILLSAIPLVKSSARRLLITIPDDVEYSLRETLSGISGLRGVAGYSVPKFWMDDRNTGHGPQGNRLVGVMHVVAVRGADMDDVRDRVRNYLLQKDMDVTIQVEREGDTSCWCGVGRSRLSQHKSVGSSSFF
ncbi:cation efflux family-domain-containing protein [Phialemonium atrogriseum]|uniref:Zinc transporter n=1 Tax=Phialemonium atrogriseum TaxID=1093897 RepID=A0AAJ0FQR5_9PEZI|nr:cation efflux family-domain-containing protein [Phialemonium atrogriseum]KAK1771554.1 cation efflux family-domain-containing protein [Phialemonium atrogriseum]